jgi:hypothetical protein
MCFIETTVCEGSSTKWVVSSIKEETFILIHIEMKNSVKIEINN